MQQVRSDIIGSGSDLTFGLKAFGRQVDWKDEEKPALGHQMVCLIIKRIKSWLRRLFKTFKESLETVSPNIGLRAALPELLLRSWGKGRKILQAFKELDVIISGSYNYGIDDVL